MEGVLLMLCANASATEEPDLGKPYVPMSLSVAGREIYHHPVHVALGVNNLCILPLTGNKYTPVVFEQQSALFTLEISLPLF